jgi:hypothetical protein
MNCYTVTLCDIDGRSLPGMGQEITAATARDAARQLVTATGTRGPNVIRVSGRREFASFLFSNGRLHQRLTYTT